MAGEPARVLLPSASSTGSRSSHLLIGERFRKRRLMVRGDDNAAPRVRMARPSLLPVPPCGRRQSVEEGDDHPIEPLTSPLPP
jgi:hypothetical protein